MSPDGFPGYDLSGPEDGVEEAPQEEQTDSSPDETAVPVSEDISTSPPTTPAPASGVQPVINAVTDESEVPGARLDASRIGEALRPPEAESPPVVSNAEEG